MTSRRQMNEEIKLLRIELNKTYFPDLARRKCYKKGSGKHSSWENPRLILKTNVQATAITAESDEARGQETLLYRQGLKSILTKYRICARVIF